MVLVIDFGSQYSELLVRKVRENKVYADIRNSNDEELVEEAEKYDALIFSGSPCCAKDELHEEVFDRLLRLKKPSLLICYGMQVIHKMKGGVVEYDSLSEFGETEVRIERDHPLVDGLPLAFKIWMSHKDSVSRLAGGFNSVAKTDRCFAMAANDREKIYTIQFHPEIDDGKVGSRLIQNFLFLICRLEKKWNVHDLVQIKVDKLKEEVGSGKICLGLSGGVDSTVVAQLMKKAELDAYYLMINTGLFDMERMQEKIDWMREELGDRFIVVDARKKFMETLMGVVDPEEKRKRIGNLFVEVFREEIRDLGVDIPFLAQGTIKSDVIESGKKNVQHTIKTHHNTVDEIHRHFKTIEPLENLFKDEVRELGKDMNIPDFMLNEKPFPGPGYAIRVLGEVTEAKVEIVRTIDGILFEILKKHGWYDKVSQCFSVLMPVQSVGVIGDQRNYGYIVGIRSINSKNMMSAKASCIPMEILSEMSVSITNQYPAITRVVYDITSKPPSTIEWE